MTWLGTGLDPAWLATWRERHRTIIRKSGAAMADATNNGNKTLSHALQNGNQKQRIIEIEVDRRLECGARMSAESVQPKARSGKSLPPTTPATPPSPGPTSPSVPLVRRADSKENQDVHDHVAPRQIIPMSTRRSAVRHAGQFSVSAIEHGRNEKDSSPTLTKNNFQRQKPRRPQCPSGDEDA